MELNDSHANAAFKVFYQKSFKEAPADTVRFFDRKGFFTVHDQNALFVADTYFKTQAALKTGSGLSYATVSQQMFQTMLRDLLCERGYRVELWQGSGGAWNRTHQASPGNLQAFEDMLDGNAMYGVATILALKVAPGSGHKLVGVAIADSSMQTFGLCEFADDDEYSTLESVLVQVSAKECLYSADMEEAELAKLQTVLQRCEVVPTERKRGDFVAKEVEADITRLSSTKYLTADFQKTHALSAAACVIKYLGLTTDQLNFGHYKMLDFDVSKFMKLDSAAIRAMHVTPSGEGAHKCTSLYGVLNKCKTAMGQRRLMQWLKQPLLDIQQIEQRLDLVETFMDDTMLRESLMEYLKRVPDMDRMAKKFAARKAGLQDCVSLYTFVKSLPELVDCFGSHSGSQEELLKSKFLSIIEDARQDCAPLEKLVESSINLKLVDQHIYEVNPSFDPSLGELDEQRKQIEAEIDGEYNQLVNDISSSIKLEFNAQYGKHLRVTRKDEKAIRGNNKLMSLATLKAGCLYTTKILKGLSESYLAANAEYEKCQRDLVKKCVEVVASYVPIMEDMRNVLSELDVFLSFAHASVSAPKQYIRPKLSDTGKGDIVLKQARHPCLELLDDSTISFIPNDVSLVRGSSQLQIITGPNMGGKSTYIRMVGMISLMAQVGCFVPCEEATLCVCDCILARVGAGDSQLHGVSTFMQEMLETAFILRTATSRSLVIIDELGRGTSTYDGFGLAWAISEHLAVKTKAMCLFATHFHELTALADEADGVKNVHVSAHSEQNKLTMLYKVVDGPCDQSFGIHVAEMVKFPEHVVQMAKRKADELENFGCAAPGNVSKRQCSEEAQAEVILQNFLKQFASLPLDTMTTDDILPSIARLTESLASQGASHPSITALMSK